MTSQVAFTALVGLVVCERIAEMILSRRNAAWSFARGGVEHGSGHFPAMVALHTAFLVGMVVEVWALQRAFHPTLGLVALIAAASCQVLRWWVIATLGPRWNTRVIVVPGMPAIGAGPYRFVRHPNYVAVVVEGVALPMVHTAWLTATVFTVLNAAVLAVRIRVEDAALATLPPATEVR